MSEKVYPDWVQKQKTTGTTVKKVGNNYYLYKHSSKRVPGKKNPVPVDTYIGKITPEGVKKSGSKKVAVNDAEVIVKEYGFSRLWKRSALPGGRSPWAKTGRKCLILSLSGNLRNPISPRSGKYRRSWIPISSWEPRKLPSREG